MEGGRQLELLQSRGGHCLSGLSSLPSFPPQRYMSTCWVLSSPGQTQLVSWAGCAAQAGMQLAGGARNGICR